MPKTLYKLSKSTPENFGLINEQNMGEVFKSFQGEIH